MNIVRLWCVALTLIAAPVFAQESEADREKVEAELRVAEERLRAAEMRLSEAAEEVAQLSGQVRLRSLRIPTEGTMVINTQRRPRLGVQLAVREVDGVRDSDGVQIVRVMPGSPALAAGIEAGDELLALEGESLRQLSVEEAIERIGGLLSDREAGDTVTALLERDGNELSKQIELQENLFADVERDFQVFSFNGGPGETREFIVNGQGVFPERGLVELAQEVEQPFWFIQGDSTWGDMELVELSEALGDYFGVDEGLLVVSAPSNEALGFEDGDVILSIGGRKPGDIDHAMRILRSYESGETLEVQITRKRRSKTLKIEVPETSNTFRYGQGG